MARLLTRREVAALVSDRFFPIKAQTIARYASEGIGPRFYKVGHRVLYAEADVLAWAADWIGPPRQATRAAAARAAGDRA